MDEKELSFLLKNGITKIAVGGNEIVWYSLGYNLKLQKNERWDCVSFDNSKYEDMIKGPNVFYRKHVAVKKNETSQWIWKIIEDSFIKDIKKKAFEYIIAEIAKCIPKNGKTVKNNFSMRYHTKKWFQKIGLVKYWECDYQEEWHLMLLKL